MEVEKEEVKEEVQTLEEALTEEKVVEPAPEQVEAPKEEVVVPQWITEAGRNAGLSDGDIGQMVKDDWEKIREIGFEYLKAKASRIDKEEGRVEPENKVEPPLKLDKINIQLDDDVPPQMKAVMENLAKNQNTLIEQLNAANEKLHGFGMKTSTFEKQQEQDRVQRVDAFFDQKAEVCPEVGTTRTMNPMNLETREQIYAIAQAIKGTGTLEQKLDKAVRAYQGMNGKAETVIRQQLERSKQKFSPRPSGRKTNSKFETKEDEAYESFMDKFHEINL